MSEWKAPEWEALERRPVDALAVAGPDSAWTVGELRAAAGAWARALTGRGVERGDRVVVALPNSPECVAAQLGVRACGAVLVNLPAPLRREVVEIAEQTGAAVVVLASDTADEPALAPLGERRLTAPVPGPQDGEDVVALPRAEDDAAWLAYTSGTTGTTKGAVHTERTLELMVQAMRERYGLGPDDGVLVAAPLGHAIAFAYGAQLALRAGCRMAVVPRWDVAVAATLTEEHGCTFVAAPTPFLLDVVEHVEAGSRGFSSLRHFLCGGAPVPPALVARANRAFGGPVASAYYGTSETGAVTTSPPGTPSAKAGETVGVPLPGMELRVVDDEVQVRGRQVCGGYWRDETEGSSFADGWYRTGDLGRVDDAGYLVLTGRRKELIIRGGVNISPVEIEQALAGAARVREVAVVGLPDDRLGQRVVAVVVADGEAPSLDALRAHCDALGLAKVKWPEQLVLRDALPRSESGKLLRRQLAGELERHG